MLPRYLVTLAWTLLATAGQAQIAAPDVLATPVEQLTPGQAVALFKTLPAPTMGNFEEKVAVITGAGSGIGRAVLANLEHQTPDEARWLVDRYPDLTLRLL